jgi:transglutaminase-like putative cysteine protease
MTRRARELETLLMTMAAAAPLYLTQAIGRVPLFLFHAVMAGIALRVAMGKGPELIPARLMRAIAIAYVPFYVLDAAVLSRSAIAASTHLVLFVAAYQPIESMQRNNQPQRLLTAALLFVASLATSTHISIVLFVIAFAFVMFRQLMYVSHLETTRALGRPYDEAASGRAALFYLAGATLIGALLFPLLPRVRNPFVQGMGSALTGATTALSDTIDFSEQRISSNDATTVARVWMGPQTVPFFTPLRLKATVYDRFDGGVWKQSRIGMRALRPRPDGSHVIDRPSGVTRPAVVQLRPVRGRLFLPVGTYLVSGVPNLYEGPRGTYGVFQVRPETLNIDVRMATEVEPLSLTRVPTSGYPVRPEVRALAQQLVGNETDTGRRAAKIERHLAVNYRYVRDPRELGRTMNLDDFLLTVKAGHCEYFAAGMVALLTAVDVPARVVGGFHGGRANPLTGYFTVRREDAHAWVEVWDGTKWRKYDPTPPTLRPGTAAEGWLRMYAAALSDSINYFWDRYVLTYGLADQVALIADTITRTRDALVRARGGIAGFSAWPAVAAIVVAIAIVLLLFRRRPSLFGLLAGHLKKLGIEVGPAMTMEEALVQLRVEHPDAARELEPLIRLYEEEEFSGRRDRLDLAQTAATIRRRLSEI